MSRVVRNGCLALFFFFKQKTAYEMVRSDWSADVCSSDLWGRGNMGNRRWTFSRTDLITGTAGDDTILLRRDGDNLQVFRQNPPVGAPAITQPVDAVVSL